MRVVTGWFGSNPEEFGSSGVGLTRCFDCPMAEEAAGARRRGLLDEGSRFLTQLGTMDEHQRASLLLAHIRATIEQVRQGLMFPLDAVVTLALTVSLLGDAEEQLRSISVREHGFPCPSWICRVTAGFRGAEYESDDAFLDSGHGEHRGRARSRSRSRQPPPSHEHAQ